MIMSYFKLFLPSKTITAATYTIDVNDFMTRGDATANAQTFTLPSAASTYVDGNGQVFVVKKVDSSVNAVTCGTMDGVTMVLSSLNSYAVFQSNGTTFDIIGAG